MTTSPSQFLPKEGKSKSQTELPWEHSVGKHHGQCTRPLCPHSNRVNHTWNWNGEVGQVPKQVRLMVVLESFWVTLKINPFSFRI